MQRIAFCAIACSLVLTSGLAGAADQAKAKPGELPPGVGRLWNLTNEPFTYQIARTSGQPWTQPVTLAPGKYQEVRLPKSGEVSEWLGLTTSGNSSLTIRFPMPQLGGNIRLSLPGRTPNDEIIPNWFLVKDSNNFGRFVQAKTIEEARAKEDELKKRPKLTPEKLEEVKEMLRANYVLTN